MMEAGSLWVNCLLQGRPPGSLYDNSAHSGNKQETIGDSNCHEVLTSDDLKWNRLNALLLILNALILSCLCLESLFPKEVPFAFVGRFRSIDDPTQLDRFHVNYN